MEPGGGGLPGRLTGRNGGSQTGSHHLRRGGQSSVSIGGDHADPGSYQSDGGQPSLRPPTLGRGKSFFKSLPLLFRGGPDKGRPDRPEGGAPGSPGGARGGQGPGVRKPRRNPPASETRGGRGLHVHRAGGDHGLLFSHGDGGDLFHLQFLRPLFRPVSFP